MSARRQTTARRLRDHMRHQARRMPAVVRGVVVDTSPLVVERLDSFERLEEDDDFDLTWSMRKFANDQGFEDGDMVLMHHENGHYSLFDVHSDAPLV
jgi:hypothetical protein